MSIDRGKLDRLLGGKPSGPAQPSGAAGRQQRLAELRGMLDRLGGRRPEERPKAPAGRRFDVMSLPGARVESGPGGEFFLTEQSRSAGDRHGTFPLLPDPDSWAALAAFAGTPGRLDDYLFVDLETTGLAGGTGTFPFMIGSCGLRDGQVRVRQYFARDLPEEPAILRAFLAELAGFRGLASFNGKAFDLPLLATRCVLARIPFEPEGLPHLDLIHLSRALWKERYDDCSLKHLERRVLGVTRSGDVDGAQVPEIYFRYLKGIPDGRLERVFYHNRFDLWSLLALAGAAGGRLAGLATGRGDPVELFSFGRLLLRRAEAERALASFRAAEAVGFEDSGLRQRNLEMIGWLTKRAHGRAGAAGVWEAMLAADPDAFRPLLELAICHEHTERDYPKALAAAERLLGVAPPSERAAVVARIERLRRKLGGREGGTERPDDGDG